MNNGKFIAGMLLYATLSGTEINKKQSDAIAARNKQGYDARAVAGLARLKIKQQRRTLGKAVEQLPALVALSGGDYVLITAVADGVAEIFDPLADSSYSLPQELLAQKYSGMVYHFSRKFGFKDILQMFNLDFFLHPVRRYRMRFVEIIIASVLLQLIAAFTPLATQVVIDKVLPNHGYSTLVVLVVALALAALFQSSLNYIRQYLYSHVAAKADLLLGARIYRKLLSLPYAYFEKRRAGDTVLRLNSLTGIREFLTGPALNSIIDTFFAALFLVIIYHISPLLMLVTLIFFPVQGALTLRAMPLLRRKLEKSWSAESDMNAYAVEMITGIRAVKSFAGESLFARGWERLISRAGASNYEFGISSTLLTNSATFAQRLGGMAILWTGALLVISGDISVGQLVAVQMLAQSAGNPIANLFALWPQFQQAAIAAERIGDIMQEPSEPAGKRSARPRDGSIELDNICFGYDNKTLLFENFSLKIADGERVAIIGHSGSGKSTLAKLIQGIYPPTGGQILVGGTDVALMAPDILRSHVSAVLQDNYIFQGSVADNIALGGAKRLNEIITAAETSGADEFLRQLPQKYATELGEQGANLSGGQRQRLAIARALLQDGKIIIFDEATSALDSISEKLFEDKFDQICADKTAIIITHRLTSVRDCNRIIVLEEGKIVEEGTHEQLVDARGVYYNLLAASGSSGFAQRGERNE